LDPPLNFPAQQGSAWGAPKNIKKHMEGDQRRFYADSRQILTPKAALAVAELK
jgi:hypothetical protein